MSFVKGFPSRVRFSRAGPWAVLIGLALAGVPGCGGGAAGYGPVGYPVCTCCCGGDYYGPVAYKQTGAQASSAKAPSVASLFDTKGPMANVSANKSPLHKKVKGHK